MFSSRDGDAAVMPSLLEDDTNIQSDNAEPVWSAAQSSLLSQLADLADNPPLRAATAPPPRLNDASFGQHLDIRLDEDYERFYQAQLASGNINVPPPLGDRTLYSDLVPGFDSSELEGILGPDVEGGGRRERGGERKASVSILQSLSQMNLAGDGAGGHEGRLSGRASPAIGNSHSYPNLSGLGVGGVQQQQQQQPAVPPGLHAQYDHGGQYDQGRQYGNTSARHSSHTNQGAPGYYPGNDPQYQAAYQAAYQALLSQHQLMQAQQMNPMMSQGPYGNAMHQSMHGVPQHLQAAMFQAMAAQQMGHMVNPGMASGMAPGMAPGMNGMQGMPSHHAQAAAAAAAAVSMMSSQHQHQGHNHSRSHIHANGHNPSQGSGRGMAPSTASASHARHAQSTANGGLNGHLARRNSRSSGRLSSMRHQNGNGSRNASSGRLNDLGRENSRSLSGSGVSDDDGPTVAFLASSSAANLPETYEKLTELKGKVADAARDQAGCRFLQRKFDEGGPASIEVVFSEIIDDILELMMDPFGNYLIQKMLDRCSEEQRLQVLQATSKDAGLISASLNTHGTRAVQKLVETLATREQTQLVVESLSPGVVKLIRDLNGNHVIQRCLQRLNPTEAQFIYDAASENCLDIATHRHGCCVLQRCIDHSTAAQRKRIITNVSVHALPLSQDPFGNYVVKYILELGQTEPSSMIMQHLKGHYASLAIQKFSSNVVEKCLKLGGSGLNEAREEVVKELMVATNLSQLLQDPYANYVMQSALTVSTGQVHSDLVEAIRPHLPTLRASNHGKRILARIQGSS